MLFLKPKSVTDLTSFKRFDVNDWDQLKGHITYKLMNTKKFNVMDNNDNIIHSNKMDLTLIYIVTELSDDRKYIMSYSITKEDLEKYNKTEDEIFQIAKQNIEYDRHRRVRTLKEDSIAKEMLYPLMNFPEGVALQSANALIEDSSQYYDNILTITNKYNVYGSSYMFDFNLLREIKSRMNSNFYIIPMSVHQLMFVSEKYVTKNRDKYEVEDDLFDMIYEMNTKNKAEDILTYRMYHYSTEDGEILFNMKQNI